MRSACAMFATILSSVSAFGQAMVDPQDGYHVTPPTRYEGQGVAGNVTPSWLVENAGWTYATAERIAQEDAAEAQRQAEAVAQASLPLQAPNGVAVQDENGHWIELVPTGDGLPVIGAQVSNSPLTPTQRATMKAERKAAHEAKSAAVKAAKNDKTKLALVAEGVFGKGDVK